MPQENPIAQKAIPRAFLGIRASIWKVVTVVVSAAIGASVGGHLYSYETTVAAIVGIFFGEAIFRKSCRTKSVTLVRE